MLFNSFEFFVFLPIIFLIYWFAIENNEKAQNVLLLISSYIFYGWWDWRFLLLIAGSSLVDFFVAKKIDKIEDLRKRKILLWVSLSVNLGSLAFFKYCNFFIDSWVNVSNSIGLDMNPYSLAIILPVGISFYTFQTMSYTIDVYRRDLKAENNPIVFFAYVSFFPQLVAGPIERATRLLPQFNRKRVVDGAMLSDGLRQILWGLFKKVVIADTCATYVNQIFDHSAEFSAISLLLGAFFFAFQIYGDFSGYSDIALGISKLFGFELMTNFKTPYFSRDIAEFWRRWHISLSTWFKDYVYIPLGGSKGGLLQNVMNTFIIFIVSGFWHGANWTFVFWGGINALYFLPLLLRGNNRKYLSVVASDSLFPPFRELVQMGGTFVMVTFTWVFFRADSISDAFKYLSRIIQPSAWFFSREELESYTNYSISSLLISILFIGFMLVMEWLHRDDRHTFTLEAFSKPVRWVVYAITLSIILLFGTYEKTEFIYFQF